MDAKRLESFPLFRDLSRKERDQIARWTDEGAEVTYCIVTDGAVIPPGTAWTRMIIRRLDGELAPGERAVGGLAVSPLIGIS